MDFAIGDSVEVKLTKSCHAGKTGKVIKINPTSIFNIFVDLLDGYKVWFSSYDLINLDRNNTPF